MFINFLKILFTVYNLRLIKIINWKALENFFCNYFPLSKQMNSGLLQCSYYVCMYDASKQQFVVVSKCFCNELKMNIFQEDIKHDTF